MSHSIRMLRALTGVFAFACTLHLFMLSPLASAHGNIEAPIAEHHNGRGVEYQPTQWSDKTPSAQMHNASASNNLSLRAGIASSWRNQDASQQYPWQIPGVLMGGKAAAPEQGITLDDAFVTLGWTNQQAVTARFEITQHGDHDLELEQGYFSYSHSFTHEITTRLSAGRLKAVFAPANSSHASSRAFSANSLLYNAFLGGHYADEGLRIQVFPTASNAVTLGAEVWRGASFPATTGSGGGAQDVFLHWQGNTTDWQWQSGIWGFLARAEERGDDRFDDDHHNNSTNSNASDNSATDNDVVFDGSQRMAGVFGSLLWRARSHLDLQLQAEWMDIEVQGDLTDPTRLAELEGQYNGYYLQPGIRFHQHYVDFRYARLILDNHLTGAGSEGLAASAGLNDMGRDPVSWEVSYRYQFNQGVGLRLEWSSNRTTREESEYWGVGVFWNAKLL